MKKREIVETAAVLWARVRVGLSVGLSCPGLSQFVVFGLPLKLKCSNLELLRAKDSDVLKNDITRPCENTIDK